MKRNILICGLFIGTILCVNMIAMVNLMYTNTSYKGSEIIGYAAQIVMFSLIFFGVRNYRNKQLEGVITFGSAFKMGALIAFLGATMYVVAWLFYYYLFVPDFIDVYTNYVLQTCSPEDIKAKATEMANFKEMYKNPLFVILITYAN